MVEDENIQNRKIDEPHKFSVDATFIRILEKQKLLKYGTVIVKLMCMESKMK